MLQSILLTALFLGAVVILAIINARKVNLFSGVDWLKALSDQIKQSDNWGVAHIGNIIDGLVVLLLGSILVFTFAPQLEQSANTSNISNATTKTFGTLASWMIPTVAIIGLIYLGVRLFLHFGKGKG